MFFVWQLKENGCCSQLGSRHLVPAFFLGAADSLPTISRQNLAPPFLLRADTWNFGMSVKWDCGSEMYGVDANP
jgi:hypothetical protein